MGLGPRNGVLAAVVGLAFALAPQGRAEGDPLPPLDYEAYWAATPEAKALSESGQAAVKKLHDLMEKLAAVKDDPEKSRATRSEVKALLEDYKAGKVKLLGLLDKALKAPRSSMTDLQILEKLRDTDLLDVHWRDAYFRNCIKDISERLRIPILLSPKVVQLNTVTADFQRSSGSGILRWLCEGFDLYYLVHDGQIVITKKLSRSDERFLEYLKKHPDWKYWLPEPKHEVKDEE